MTLEKRFDTHMQILADRTKEETGYNPTGFRGMLTELGGYETAIRLVMRAEPSDGYTKLWELKRLDLTVEAQILDNPDWHGLFDPEVLDKCRDRLKNFEYEPKY